MSAIAAVTLVFILAVLVVVGFGPTLAARLEERRGRRHSDPRPSAYDPGRELRAERRARGLLRSIVGGEQFAMYEELGLLRVIGETADGRPNGYGYLIYPHRPIIAYDTETDEPLSEYCVEFPDRSETAYGPVLPDADDVLAKWMSLHGAERKLIGDANMHLPGRQVDPAHVRRDLLRLRTWEASRQREAVRGT